MALGALQLAVTTYLWNAEKVGSGLKNQLFWLLSLLLVCGSAEAAQRTDRLDLIGGSSGSGKLDIYEDTDDGSNKTRLQVPAMASNITYTLPADDGDASEVLTTDGAGVLTWEAVAGSGDITAVGDVASGAAFNGTQGTTLTFNNAGGDQTISYDGAEFTVSTNTAVTGSFSATNIAANNGTLGTLRVGTALSPLTNDSSALGTTALGFSDLHLASGGVINWANGQVTLTESTTNELTLAGGTLLLSTDGFLLNDGLYGNFGSSGDSGFAWDTTGNDHLQLYVASGASAAESGYVVISADTSHSLALTTDDDPHLLILTGNEASYLNLYHNRTNAVINVKAGESITMGDVNNTDFFSVSTTTTRANTLTLTNALTTVNGGTGSAAGFSLYSPIYAGTTSTSAFQSGSLGLVGHVLTSNGASALPTFQAAGSGSGDITSVGDVTSGAAFDGTQGTTLTFYNSGGNSTVAYTGTQISVSKPVVVTGTSSQIGGDNGYLINFDQANYLTLISTGFENLNLDLETTSNTAILFSTTGVTSLNMSAIDISVPDEVYGAGWNGSLEVPTKNALYDKIETISGGSLTIGDSITSGTATLVLFEDSSNNLAEDATFSFSTTTKTLTVNSITTGTIKSTSLTPSKCVKTDAYGHLISAADDCGSASGGVVVGNGVTSGTANRILYEDGSNNVAEDAGLTYTDTTDTFTTTNAVITNGTLTTVNATDGTVTRLSLAGGGTLGQIWRAGGAGATGAWSTATYPGAAASGGSILRGASGNWAQTSATYPESVTAGRVIVANATNSITQSGVDFTVTSGGGIVNVGTLAVTSATITNGTATTNFEIPNGAGGTTVDETGEVTVDSTSRSFNFYDGTTEAVLNPIERVGATIVSPVAGDDITLLYTDFALTVVELEFVNTASLAPTTTVIIKSSTNRGDALTATAVVTAGTIVSSTLAGQSVTSFDNAAISAGKWVWVEVSEADSGIDTTHVNVKYRQDA